MPELAIAPVAGLELAIAPVVAGLELRIVPAAARGLPIAPVAAGLELLIVPVAEERALPIVPVAAAVVVGTASVGAIYRRILVSVRRAAARSAALRVG